MAESRKKPEIWAGIECTVNRVGDRYYDQLEFNGHTHRSSDLDLFAWLGIKTMRYPLIWERIAPNGPNQADWRWGDERLERLRQLGIRPIVGLVHHGSGPRETNLADAAFPERLAEFARAVAERYPWIDAYTPINEPLTTARFSGLYGYWYPHGHSETIFAQALLNQVRATQLAMRAIRQVNPAAQLIQTEDLGKTFSTPPLDYQADYENTRRWMSLDLLTGRMNRQHSLYDYFDWAGIPENELLAVIEDPCPPDIIGLNYYITSERFLDHRLERYPSHLHGGNGKNTYADLEVVRVCEEGIAGISSLLREAWDRYQRPLAVTEVHLGSSRDEQLRWLMDIWESVREIEGAGVDVRAITAWSLLGTYNWNCLVTKNSGHYEPGVFDLRSSQPRPTILARAIQQLIRGEDFDHPVLDVPGWWRRAERLLYPPVPRRDEHAYLNVQSEAQKDPQPGPTEDGLQATSQISLQSRVTPRTRSTPRRMLIIGATGTLGNAFKRISDLRGLHYTLASHKEIDIADRAAVMAMLEEIRPWAVINTAGYVRVDEAEREQDLCRRTNTDGPANLAVACAQLGIQLLTFSSDLVFDGSQSTPYTERSRTAPLNVYGYCKAESEKMVLDTLPSALVIRTSAFFGPWDNYNFATLALRALASGQPFVAANNTTISPTFVPDLVTASLDLLIDQEYGIWHLANSGEVTWLDFARSTAEAAGLDPRQIEGRTIEELNLLAPRPHYSVLGSERGSLLPPLEDAISRYCRSVSPAEINV